VLKQGTVSKPKGRPPGSKNVRGPQVFGVDEHKLVTEIRKRSKGNTLHQMADELHLGVLLANLRIIEEIKSTIDNGRIMIADVAESKGLLSALKGATAEVTSAMKALGLSAATRKEEKEDDDLLKRLAELNLDELLPESLQSEYLRAEQDLARTEGKEGLEEEQDQDTGSVLASLKKPIRAYGDDEERDEPTESKVHDPRKDGLVIS